MKELLSGLSKWPLLLGATVAFGLAVYEETVTDNTEVLVGIAGIVVGSFLLGTWLALYIIDFERRWVAYREGKTPPSRSEESGVESGHDEGTG